jgi:hypothetical protein
MTKRLITILWLFVQCAAYAQTTTKGSKGLDVTNAVDVEALKDLLPRFGRIMDNSMNLLKNGEVDTELWQMSIDGKVRDLITKFKIGTPESGFVQLPELIHAVDGMAVRPAYWDFFPEKRVTLPGIKKALGKEGTVRLDTVVMRDQSVVPPGFPTPATSVDVRLWRYGRWEFGGTTNDATVVVRVHFDPSPIKRNEPVGKKP